MRNMFYNIFFRFIIKKQVRKLRTIINNQLLRMCKGTFAGANPAYPVIF